jgi:hypothetical protein
MRPVLERASSTQSCRRDEIHEQPNAGRRRPAGQESGEEIDAVTGVIGEAFDKSSGLQIFGHVPERLEREALPSSAQACRTSPLLLENWPPTLISSTLPSTRKRQRSCRRWRRAKPRKEVASQYPPDASGNFCELAPHCALSDRDYAI